MSQRATTPNHQISSVDKDGFCLKGYDLVGGTLCAQLGSNTSYEHVYGLIWGLSTLSALCDEPFNLHCHFTPLLGLKQKLLQPWYCPDVGVICIEWCEYIY
jgi:hypothetical protein